MAELPGRTLARELIEQSRAVSRPLPAYFGLPMMFSHIHPLARAAQNYYQEAAHASASPPIWPSSTTRSSVTRT